MSDFRELSKLPDDPCYWSDLETRVLSELGPAVRERVWETEGWWAPLAKRAWVLGGLALAAGVAALLLMPPRSVNGRAVPAGLLRVPATDSTVISFVSAPAPPPLATLVLPGRRVQ
jgi:hypothetical protein